MGWTLRMIGNGVKSVLWFVVKTVAGIVVCCCGGLGMGHGTAGVVSKGRLPLHAGAVSWEAWYELVQRKRLIG